jgi:hypothetical protein
MLARVGQGARRDTKLRRGKGLKANLKAARRVSVSPDAIFAALVCSLFGGTGDGCAHILC